MYRIDLHYNVDMLSCPNLDWTCP